MLHIISVAAYNRYNMYHILSL